MHCINEFHIQFLKKLNFCNLNEASEGLAACTRKMQNPEALAWNFRSNLIQGYRCNALAVCMYKEDILQQLAHTEDKKLLVLAKGVLLQLKRKRSVFSELKEQVSSLGFLEECVIYLVIGSVVYSRQTPYKGNPILSLSGMMETMTKDADSLGC